MKNQEPKILILDIETSPNMVYSWGLWNQNIAINQIVESSTVLCWAGKWLGKKQTEFSSVHHDSPKVMIKKIHAMIDEADAVITYNGKKFDMPQLNKEFLKHGLTQPSPYKDIDLLQTCRRKFKLPSNKLDYVAQFLGVGKKTPHMGMPLWTDCMNGCSKAWKTMKKYNIQDVNLTEEVYNKLLGWIVTPFNYNTHADGQEVVCPNCGGKHLQKRGTMRTTTRQYQRYQCQDCGTWSKGNKALNTEKQDDFIRRV